MSQNLLVRELEYKETYLSDSFYSGCEQTTQLMAMRHAQCIPAAFGGRDVLGLESVRFFWLSQAVIKGMIVFVGAK